MKSATISIVGLALILSAGCEEAGFGGKKPRQKAKFSVTNSGPLTIEQGGTASLTVTVTRDEGFVEPVTITLRSVPGGLELISGEKEVTADEVTYTFKAGEKLKPASSLQTPVYVKSETGGKVTMPFGTNITAKPEPEEEEAAKPEEPAAEGE